MLRDLTVTEGRSREQSLAPEARDVVPTLAPKMPNVNMLVVLLSSHLLGHAAPSRGNTGGAQHLRKRGGPLSQVATCLAVKSWMEFLGAQLSS